MVRYRRRLIKRQRYKRPEGECPVEVFMHNKCYFTDSCKCVYLAKYDMVTNILGTYNRCKYIKNIDEMESIDDKVNKDD